MTTTADVTQEAIELLKTVTTGMVIDALAMSGIQGGIPGIRPSRGFEDAKVVGPAVTVLFAPARPDSPKLNNYQVVRDSKPGTVLVIDGKGVDGHFTGDNQGEVAKRQGMLGVVVYGGARDVSGYRQIGIPLYCTGSATADKPKDLVLTAYNVPIEIGGVLVKPGDVIVADEDGVVAVPSEALAQVVENMKTIFEVEAGMEAAIKRDASLAELSAIIGKKKPK
ncbi:MAG: hypothetical protein HY329_19200 [Chloroflexi bacterium]|nr:hypothetical protein [Chloroflexota bacterium]